MVSTHGLVMCFAVYATTAANSHESSYACYYDEKRDTYLGDWYSVNWMEDSDVVGSPFYLNLSLCFISPFVIGAGSVCSRRT